MAERVFVLNALRTPFGKLGGILAGFTPVTLGATLVKNLINESGISPEVVDEVHLGCCIQCAEVDVAGPVIARQVLLEAGLPDTVVSSTIDRACCSSTAAIQTGLRAIQSGDVDIVIAGGSEIMSKTPHIARDFRWGKKIGNIKVEDPLFAGGYKKYNPVSVDAGEVALEYEVSREEQDKWAYLSQMRYQEALKEGKFKEEIMPVEIADRKGNTMIFDKDEFPRASTTLEGLAKLPTVYGSPTITPGNAPGINDGAAAVILIGETKLKELGLEPLAEILSFASACHKPKNIPIVPALAINKALDRAEMKLEDIELIEINEAFAAMPLVSSKILGNNNEGKIEELRSKININGGAIAIGHPISATGARLLMTLIYELKRRGGGYGVSAICGGLAQGDAVVIRV